MGSFFREEVFKHTLSILGYLGLFTADLPAESQQADSSCISQFPISSLSHLRPIYDFDGQIVILPFLARLEWSMGEV